MRARFAMLALLPAILGPLPAQARGITASLCNGGTISIPLEPLLPAPGTTPCCAKGCHGSHNRKRIDRTQ